MARKELTLIGRPFAPIGMGQMFRSTFRSLKAVGVDVNIINVSNIDVPDLEMLTEFSPHLVDNVNSETAIFCINGNEIDDVLNYLGDRGAFRKRIIQPAWELPLYPEEWTIQVNRFDEAWGFSKFVAESLGHSVTIPVSTLPLATQINNISPLGRGDFGIRDSAYTFLFFFDFLSFIERKNPFATLEAFRRLLEKRPANDLQFVIKANSSNAKPTDYLRFLNYIQPFGDQIVLIDQTLPDPHVKSLLLLADAYISLHRSEGYGFGMAEAMFLEKPVIATGWSGNMDFMNRDNSFLVSYKLVDVPEFAYPHAKGQVWAEPNVEEATDYMLSLVDNPDYGRLIGQRASRHIKTYFSHRAIGLKALELLG